MGTWTCHGHALGTPCLSLLDPSLGQKALCFVRRRIHRKGIDSDRRGIVFNLQKRQGNLQKDRNGGAWASRSGQEWLQPNVIRGHFARFGIFHRFDHYCGWHGARTLGHVHRSDCDRVDHVGGGKADQQFYQQASFVQDLGALLFDDDRGFLACRRLPF